eukprot:TRINITY_DN23199_c0_g1_i1.p1 TRINITY_DN23199_c0_g1~~TRINITY_DN23199_c0_g1_i1.p1  ORF type:complete len:422 (+),score=84.24 TRINITY_DN23199_c0_g1_i1:55-1266(+)
MQMMEGDWICAGCGDHQFARNTQCRKCGAAKSAGGGGGGVGGGAKKNLPWMSSQGGGGGGGGGGGSGGGGGGAAGGEFMQGDWNCPSCGDHQFARNTNCRKCGAAKADGAGGSAGAGAGDGGGGGDGACDQIWVGGLPEETDQEFLKAIFSAYGEIVWCKVFPADGGGKAKALIQFADHTDAEFCANNLNGNIPEGLTQSIKCRLAPRNGGSGGGGGGGGGGGKGPGALPQALLQTLVQGLGKAGGKGGGKNNSGPYPMQAVLALAAGKGFGGQRGAAGMVKGAIKGGVIKPMKWGSKPECSVFIRNLPSDTTNEHLYELFSYFGAIPPGGVLAQKKDDNCSGVGFVDFIEEECAQRAIDALNGLPTPEGQFLFVTLKYPKKQKKVQEEDPEALARILEAMNS